MFVIVWMFEHETPSRMRHDPKVWCRRPARRRRDASARREERGLGGRAGGQLRPRCEGDGCNAHRPAGLSIPRQRAPRTAGGRPGRAGPGRAGWTESAGLGRAEPGWADRVGPSRPGRPSRLGRSRPSRAEPAGPAELNRADGAARAGQVEPGSAGLGKKCCGRY